MLIRSDFSPTQNFRMASPHILDFILLTVPLTPYTIGHTSSPAFLSSLIMLQPHWLFLVFWTCLPCSHRRLLPLPGTLFPQISLCLTPSVHSDLCTNVISSETPSLTSLLRIVPLILPTPFTFLKWRAGQSINCKRKEAKYMDTDGWS